MDKTCNKCSKRKPTSEFHKDKSTKDGLNYTCKHCACERHRKEYLANPEKYRERNRQNYLANTEKYNERSRQWRLDNPGKCRENHLKRYGITVEQRDAILDSQGGGCAVCGIKLDGKTKITQPHVDHCHETGVVRGILCRNHNSAEGLLGGIENARRMLAYMEKNALFYSSATS